MKNKFEISNIYKYLNKMLYESTKIAQKEF